MSHTSTIITIFYIVLVVIGTIVVGTIAWSTLVKRRPEPDTHALAERERVWLLVALLLLAALLFSTIFFTPYGESAGKSKQVVTVQAQQFAWVMSTSTIKAGVPVEFRLSSTDVSHGFGIYNADGALLKQVQVLPDREQRLIYTFKKPGTYQILCIEFCGVGHDKMETTIEVTA